MSSPTPTPARRADAQRNRQRLLDVSLAALSADSQVPLDAIAREAGVGIGTLYRHFPTRGALVEAVYEAELEKVCRRAAPLIARHPGDVALRRWLVRYADFVATKRGMGESLQALMSSDSFRPGDTRQRIRETVASLLDAGSADGTLRAGADAEDVTAAMVGVLLASSGPKQTARLLDLLVDGLRVSPERSGARPSR